MLIYEPLSLPSASTVTNSCVEKHSLKITFDQIRQIDPFGIQQNYRLKIDPSLQNDSQFKKKYFIEYDQFITKFYIVFYFFTIGIVLSSIFFSLWFFSPQLKNLKIVQKDVQYWNQQKINEKMAELQFQFQIFPDAFQAGAQDISFKDQPLEKDESQLQKSYNYKLAYFYQQKALKSQNISDIFWVEDTVDNILLNQDLLKKQNSSSDYQESQLYCLSLQYKVKNDVKHKQYQLVHSNDPDQDKFQITKKQETQSKASKPQAPFQQESKNPFKQDEENQNDYSNDQTIDKNEKTIDQPCLQKFAIWKETGVNLFSSSSKELQYKINEFLNDDQNQKEICEKNNTGIYINETCHFYKILTSLCVKINIEVDDQEHIQNVVYDSGCYENQLVGLYEYAHVKQQFSLGNNVSLQIRSAKDPYYIYSFARDNLDTTFNLCFYLSMITFAISFFSLITIIYYFMYKLQRIKFHQPNSMDINRGISVQQQNNIELRDQLQ